MARFCIHVLVTSTISDYVFYILLTRETPLA